MKKIKSLLGIGILGALFSTCFGATEIASVNQYRYITTSGDNRIGNYVISEVSNSPSTQSKIFYSYSVNYFSGVNQIHASPYPYTGLVYFPKSGNYIFSYDLFSPNGFSFNVNDSLLFHIIGGNELIYNYSSSDFSSLPMVFTEDGNYFTFRTDSSLLYNFSEFPFNSIGTLKYCFYGIDYSFSCVFSTGSDYVFKSFYYDPTINDVRFSDGVLIIPLFTQSTPLNGTSSILLYYHDNEDLVYYNLYDCYSSDPNILSTCNVIDKGYFNNITKSNFSSRSFADSPSSQSELYYYGGNYIFRSFLLNRHSDTSSQFCVNHPLNCTSRFSIDITSSDTTPIFVLIPYTGSSSQGGGNINGSPVSSSSLYLNCLGPIYNTPDGLPPAYCFNSSGELDPSLYSNCFDSVDSEYNVHNYCYIDGVLQEINVVPYGSGFVPVACGDNCFNSNILDVLDSNSTGYSVDYFENYLNTTGFFFKCPRPYDNKLTLRPKLITLLNGIDLLIPVNCSIAGFSYGKNFLTFENSGHFIPNGPLLNFEGDNWSLLYYFFDIIISIGIVIFVGKIFYLFHK